MIHSGDDRNADAGKQCKSGVDILNQLRTGYLLIGVHKVLYISFRTQKPVFSLIVVGNPDDGVQPDGLAHGIQLGNLRIALLKPGPQTHGHLQAESGAAGNPQFLKTEHCIGHAGKESQREQGIDAETALEQFPDAVQHQRASQQSRYQHGQNLTENHKPEPVFRHHIQHEQGGDTGGQQNNQHIQKKGDLQLGGTNFRQGVILLFRPCHQLFLQLLQTGAGGEDNGRGNKLLLHLEGGLNRGGSARFRGSILCGIGVGIIVGNLSGFLCRSLGCIGYCVLCRACLGLGIRVSVLLNRGLGRFFF